MSETTLPSPESITKVEQLPYPLTMHETQDPDRTVQECSAVRYMLFARENGFEPFPGFMDIPDVHSSKYTFTIGFPSEDIRMNFRLLYDDNN